MSYQPRYFSHSSCCSIRLNTRFDRNVTSMSGHSAFAFSRKGVAVESWVAWRQRWHETVFPSKVGRGFPQRGQLAIRINLPILVEDQRLQSPTKLMHPALEQFDFSFCQLALAPGTPTALPDRDTRLHRIRVHANERTSAPAGGDDPNVEPPNLRNQNSRLSLNGGSSFAVPLDGTLPMILSTGFLICPNLDLKLPTPRRMTGLNPSGTRLACVRKSRAAPSDVLL